MTPFLTVSRWPPIWQSCLQIDSKTPILTHSDMFQIDQIHPFWPKSCQIDPFESNPNLLKWPILLQIDPFWHISTLSERHQITQIDPNHVILTIFDHFDTFQTCSKTPNLTIFGVNRATQSHVRDGDQWWVPPSFLAYRGSSKTTF